MNTENPKFIVLDKGHTYILNNFEKTDEKGQTIQFIHKEPAHTDPSTATEYKTVANGTTNEAVIEMLIDRLNYLQSEHQEGKFKCKENACAITHLEEALHWLESRTKKRVARGVEGKHIA